MSSCKNKYIQYLYMQRTSVEKQSLKGARQNGLESNEQRSAQSIKTEKMNDRRVNTNHRTSINASRERVMTAQTQRYEMYLRQSNHPPSFRTSVIKLPIIPGYSRVSTPPTTIKSRYGSMLPQTPLQSNLPQRPPQSRERSELPQTPLQSNLPQRPPQSREISELPQTPLQSNLPQRPPQSREISELLQTPLQVPKAQSTGSGNLTNTEVLRVTINSVNGGTKTIFVLVDTTGGQLKKIIYNDICQSLQVNQMSIKYQGSVIGNNKKLSDINIVTGKNLVIDQDKIAVAEVANIIADAEGIDPISEEKGVAKMCCGHGIGRDTMSALIRSLISANKYEIRCPYPDENNLICSALWAFKDCKKVGVFTKEEQAEFEEGLSINWMKNFTKKCPKCSQQIFKSDLKTNRVICSSCQYGDFCFLCLKKWKGGDKCGNEDCVFLNGFLKSCPWDRTFQLRTNGKVQNYKTPRYRACVHCNTVIEHEQACKHMACKACAMYFCWVCLQTPSKGVWPCGGPFEYCGKVAQIQNF